MAAKEGARLNKWIAKQKSFPFSSVTLDNQGASAILPAAAWKEIAADYPEARVDRGFRVLACEGEADWTTPGFLPVIGRALAEGNIAAGFLTGFRRLHLIVPARQMKDTRIFFDLLSNQSKGRLQQERSRLQSK